MARRASIATMIAATAIIGLPVLAQTTTGTATTGPSSPGMSTTTRPVSPGLGPTGSTVSSPAKYFTADHQIRVSKMVGSSVYNDQNVSIGSIDDVLMSDTDHKAGTAVISVGGFLGMGSKLVSVPFDQIKVENDKIVLPGATKASLEGMPDYHYTNV
jgi:sporulation protein YlmC with PRC-barrel domain